jgi:2-keto-4-pentenoate hydratase/2-oxohepta-3-ene-1,7-dioic acid hydratase in catechol pathway
MRIGRVDGRLAIFDDDGVVDVETASDGAFGSALDGIFPHWEEFLDWAHSEAGAAPHAAPVATDRLGAPVVKPAQIFGIGLNYHDHAAESGVAVPDSPAVFTKFPTCLTGPSATIELPSATVDWEVELVAVIGRAAERVAEEKAWAYVAGLTVGNDISERTVQMAGPIPQFSLGKSYPGFGPIGPWIVTVDEFDDPDDLALRCELDGRLLQHARTRDMVFSVPELVARLSAVCPLLPGDLIFTGTPGGAGFGCRPPHFLRPGETLVSSIEGIGELRNPLVAGPDYG